MTGLTTLPRALAGIAALALAPAVPAPLAAQDAVAAADPAPYVTPRATAYAEAAKLPDWTGIWYPDWAALFDGRAAARPQLTPEAQARFDAYQKEIAESGPNQEQQIKCLPPGLPGVMQQPYPIEILYSPGRVTIFTEAYEQARRIYTDGRPLPEDPDLFFNGNSIGRWEGDVLHVTTVGLHPSTAIVPGLNHSEQARVEERIWLEQEGQLIDEMTFIDPEVLTAPFVVRVVYKLDNAYPLREWVCSENNRLVTDGHGANIDLGLDEEGQDPFGPASED